MSTETSAPTSTEAAPPAPPVTPETTAEPGLEVEEIEALESTGASGEETVKIGDVDVPLSALSQLPDDVLRRIKRKIKSAGAEREISLAEALEAVPKADGWQRRMAEAAAQRKQLEAIADRMGTDVIGAFAAVRGITRAQAMDALAEQYVRESKREAMTPEERAAEERQLELERKAKLADEYEAKQREERIAQATAKTRERLLSQMKPALEGAGVKASKHAIARVALTLDAAIKHGVIEGEPSAEDVAWAAREVAKELAEDREGYLPEDAEGDALIERIGEKRARKIAQAMAKRARKAAPPVERRRDGTFANRTPSNGQPQTWEEFIAAADARQGIRR